MKRIFLLLLIGVAALHAKAQNNFPDSGNVLIGTRTSAGALTVNGSIAIWSLVGSGNPRPAITAGTARGEIRAMSPNRADLDDGFFRLSAGGGSNASAKTYIDISGYSTTPDMDRNIVFGTLGTERIRILSNGNVGIGTSTPNVKLAVNGDIKAKRLRVTATEWPDYVFGKDYQLMDILEVAAFIEKNKHLPEVPSETDIRKTEEVDLGDMNKILLKKIEELTLYIIELKKENLSMIERLDRNNIK
ncbi:hypothetical protein DVR12_05270 [Chitinophaga silvatica]|uniref:Chaperone of endosialidase n=1 Tax=Chitinophaga silvatica TaxID=2282649 RepID=A0A3E1YDI9_9BACT|nr:hypothetical protein [Chitinophaga silvatica]RFS24615.1 hypothetical protein DVR12_05270 [Chitinophaga silvatica]